MKLKMHKLSKINIIFFYKERDLSFNKILKKIFVQFIVKWIYHCVLHKTSIWNGMFDYFIINEKIKNIQVYVSFYTIRTRGEKGSSNQQQKFKAHR